MLARRRPVASGVRWTADRLGGVVQDLVERRVHDAVARGYVERLAGGAEGAVRAIPGNFGSETRTTRTTSWASCDGRPEEPRPAIPRPELVLRTEPRWFGSSGKSPGKPKTEVAIRTARGKSVAGQVE